MNKGKVYVFTSMVGDLFHFGHLELLRRAKDLGTDLIVGVISDNEVLRYKGRLPIFNQEDRLKIISSIRYVDKVILQHERDGSAILKELKIINILTRGDDTILKDEVVTIKAMGGSFVHLPRTKEISTSLLLQKIRGLHNE